MVYTLVLEASALGIESSSLSSRTSNMFHKDWKFSQK